jgi:DNA-binding beta-propeller fold protein YncE
MHEPHLYTAVNMGTTELLLMNTETDQLLRVPLAPLSNWPGGMVNHSWVALDGRTVYICTNATASEPSSAVILEVDIDWEHEAADAVIKKVIMLDPAGSPSHFPEVKQTDLEHPIAAWTHPALLQAHGPTFLPHSPYTYLTNWTDNRIRVINTDLGQLVDFDPLTFDTKSRQTHGINFNPSGRLGLGTGYFYDQNTIEVYRANRKTGVLSYVHSIKLGLPLAYAAFTHYTAWLDDRFALTGTMQIAPTSLTPARGRILGPSVWLLDAHEGNALRIINTAHNPDEPGIFRSASDVAIAGHKLYVGEEDSLDFEFGEDGYVSIFDISDVINPVFLKRLKPGTDLPADFAGGHTMVVTNDEHSVYVSSYVSNHIIKIDTTTDTVAKVFSAADGLDMPHGEFIAGRYR